MIQKIHQSKLKKDSVSQVWAGQVLLMKMKQKKNIAVQYSKQQIDFQKE